MAKTFGKTQEELEKEDANMKVACELVMKAVAAEIANPLPLKGSRFLGNKPSHDGEAGKALVKIYERMGRLPEQLQGSGRLHNLLSLLATNELKKMPRLSALHQDIIKMLENQGVNLPPYHTHRPS